MDDLSGKRSKMKCIIISNDGKPKYIDKKDPEIKKGWARIKVIYAGLCGSDLTKIFSDKKARISINKNIWGHEFSGIVDKIQGNSYLKQGDKVVVQPLIFDKTNEILNSKSLGKEYDGGFSEYALVPIENLIKVPKDIPLDLATLAEPLAVCFHALDLGDVKKRSKTLVVGDGSIGMLISLLLESECEEVWIKGKNPDTLKLASKMGIKIFDPKKNNLDSYDRIFETVGRKQDITLKQSISFVSPKGKIIILGVFQKDYLNKLVLRDLFFKEASIVGSNCYEGLKDFKKALKFIEKNKKDLQNIITHKIKLKDFEKALDLVRNKKKENPLKILLVP